MPEEQTADEAAVVLLALSQKQEREEEERRRRDEPGDTEANFGVTEAEQEASRRRAEEAAQRGEPVTPQPASLQPTSDEARREVDRLNQEYRDLQARIAAQNKAVDSLTHNVPGLPQPPDSPFNSDALPTNQGLRPSIVERGAQLEKDIAAYNADRDATVKSVDAQVLRQQQALVSIQGTGGGPGAVAGMGEDGTVGLDLPKAVRTRPLATLRAAGFTDAEIQAAQLEVARQDARERLRPLFDEESGEADLPMEEAAQLPRTIDVTAALMRGASPADLELLVGKEPVERAQAALRADRPALEEPVEAVLVYPRERTRPAMDEPAPSVRSAAGDEEDDASGMGGYMGDLLDALEEETDGKPTKPASSAVAKPQAVGSVAVATPQGTSDATPAQGPVLDRPSRYSFKDATLDTVAFVLFGRGPMRENIRGALFGPSASNQDRHNALVLSRALGIQQAGGTVATQPSPGWAGPVDWTMPGETPRVSLADAIAQANRELPPPKGLLEASPVDYVVPFVNTALRAGAYDVAGREMPADELKTRLAFDAAAVAVPLAVSAAGRGALTGASKAATEAERAAMLRELFGPYARLDATLGGEVPADLASKVARVEKAFAEYERRVTVLRNLEQRPELGVDLDVVRRGTKGVKEAERELQSAVKDVVSYDKLRVDTTLGRADPRLAREVKDLLDRTGDNITAGAQRAVDLKLGVGTANTAVPSRELTPAFKEADLQKRLAALQTQKADLEARRAALTADTSRGALFKRADLSDEIKAVKRDIGAVESDLGDLRPPVESDLVERISAIEDDLGPMRKVLRDHEAAEEGAEAFLTPLEYRRLTELETSLSMEATALRKQAKELGITPDRPPTPQEWHGTGTGGGKPPAFTGPVTDYSGLPPRGKTVAVADTGLTLTTVREPGPTMSLQQIDAIIATAQTGRRATGMALVRPSGAVLLIEGVGNLADAMLAQAYGALPSGEIVEVDKRRLADGFARAGGAPATPPVTTTPAVDGTVAVSPVTTPGAVRSVVPSATEPQFMRMPPIESDEVAPRVDGVTAPAAELTDASSTRPSDLPADGVTPRVGPADPQTQPRTDSPSEPSNPPQRQPERVSVPTPNRVTTTAPTPTTHGDTRTDRRTGTDARIQDEVKPQTDTRIRQDTRTDTQTRFDRRTDTPSKPPRPPRLPRPPRAPIRQGGGRGMVLTGIEWASWDQGIVRRYKNVFTGQEVARRLKQPRRGKGSAAASYRVLSYRPGQGRQRVDRMGVVNARVNGRLSYNRNVVNRRQRRSRPRRRGRR